MSAPDLSAEEAAVTAPIAPRPVELERMAIRRRLEARLFGTPFVPVKLGRFRILRLLGQGGMGQVFAAEDDQLRRVVAIKVIRPGGARPPDAERARLLREARALASLSHRNVVHVYEVSEQGDDVFIAMEYIAGRTLDGWLATAPRSVAEIVAVFVAAGHGLAAAHSAGLTHRDFKPGNVMIGDDGRVCILDFGLARGAEATASGSMGEVDPRRLATGRGSLSSDGVAGTPAYMAPEQVRDHVVSALSDQFSFCVALYEALFQRRPFDQVQILKAPVGCAPDFSGSPFGSGAPMWLRRLLTRGLDFDPARRFSGMKALLEVLEVTRLRRRRAAWLLSGVMALASAALAGTQVAAGPSACAAVGAPLLPVWSQRQRDDLRHAFLATGRPHAASQAAHVTAELDEYAMRWLAARRDTCEATHAYSLQSPIQNDRSTLCLERGRRGLATLTEVLARPDPAMLAAAPELVGTLPDPRSCRDPEMLMDQGPHRLHQRAEEVQRRLDLAAFLQTARLGPAARTAAERALAVSRASHDGAAEAEALLLLGRLHAHVFRDGKRAAAALHAADVRATQSGHDAILWSIWNELARVDADLREAPDDASFWLEKARSALARRPDPDPLIEASLLDTAGDIDRIEDNTGRALMRSRQALEIRQRHLSPEDPRLVWSRVRLANAFADDGAVEEALVRLRALHETEKTRLGGEHPIVAFIGLSLALVYIDRREFTRAEPLLRAARAAFVATYGSGSSHVASTDLALSQTAAGGGDPFRAIVHAQAALVSFGETFPATYSERISALTQLAELYRISEQHTAALRINLELLALADEDPEIRGTVPEILVNIGNYLCLSEQCGAALPYFSRLAEYSQGDPLQLAYSLQGIGRASLARRDPARAFTHLDAALRIFEEHPESAPELTALTARLLADSLRAQNLGPRRVRKLLADAERIEQEVSRRSSQG